MEALNWKPILHPMIYIQVGMRVGRKGAPVWHSLPVYLGAQSQTYRGYTAPSRQVAPFRQGVRSVHADRAVGQRGVQSTEYNSKSIKFQRFVMTTTRYEFNIV